METESSSSSINVRSKKQKNHESGPGAGRAKRQQYTLVACDGCKERKIRCSGGGEARCARCTKLNIPCLYAKNSRSSDFKETVEYKEMLANMTALQRQVNDLVANLNSLQEIQRAPPVNNLSPCTCNNASMSSTPQIIGPESPPEPEVNETQNGIMSHFPEFPEFNFNAVNNEVLGTGQHNADAEAISAPSREMQVGITRTKPQGMHPTKEPLWAISKGEVIRLCYIYEEEVGSMYPLLYIDGIVLYAEKLYRFIEAALRTGMARPDMPGADALLGEDTSILKVVIAIAMVVEGRGKSAVGMRLVESLGLVQRETMKEMVLCILMAIFHLQRGDIVMAWALMSDTARAWFANGPHRHDMLLQPVASGDASRREYFQVTNLSWFLYNLDRRLSSTLERPFETDVGDIENSMPMPDHLPFYFPRLVQYNKIVSQIWELLQGPEPLPIQNAREINRQSPHITAWYQNLPQSLQYFDLGSAKEAALPSDSPHHHRVLLRLRHNHALMLISYPLLDAAVQRSFQHNQDPQEERNLSGRISRLAKDSIYVISNLSKNSDKYHKHQIALADFLVSAIAAIIQVVSYAPDDFSVPCREAFDLALGLIQDLPDGSRALSDLRRAIEKCKVADSRLKLALSPHVSVGVGQEEDAAIAMAELAGHSTGGLTVDAADQLLDGKQVAYELDVVFSTADACGPTTNFGGIYEALAKLMIRLL